MLSGKKNSTQQWFMQRAGCLIGKGKQCVLVKLLIYILEWHKGKETLCSPLIYQRGRSAVTHDRMGPNNSELSEIFWLLKSTISQRCYFPRLLYITQALKVVNIKVAARSSKNVFAHLIICFNAPLNYAFLLPLLSNLPQFQSTMYHISSTKNSSFFTSKLQQQSPRKHSLVYSVLTTNSASNICSSYYRERLQIILVLYVYTHISARCTNCVNVSSVRLLSTLCLLSFKIIKSRI